MRNLKVYKINLIASFIWVVICFTELLLMNSLGYSEHNLKIITVVSIVNCFFQIITIRSLGNQVISFFAAFVVFLYMFHFGQAFTASFFPNVNLNLLNYILNYMTDKENTWKALTVSLFSIGMIFSGGILVNSRYLASNKEYSYKEVNDNTISYNICRTMGMFLFVISVPFKVYYDIRQLSAAVIGGYAAARTVESFSGVFGAIASFWYISVVLIYLTIKSTRIKSAFLLISIGYICLTMLTGNRGHQVVSIISILLIVYYSSDKRVKISKIIKWVIIGFVALVFLNWIFDVRKYSISYLASNFWQLLGEAFQDNILIETLHNFGATIFTPYLVLIGYGTLYTPFWGETYIKSIVSIIPDAFHIFNKINNEAIFSRVIDTNHAIGGSFIGELYYNFGEMYWLGAFVFGILFGVISRKIYIAVKEHDYKTICFCFPLASYSLWWVRDTVGGVTRPVVWLFLIYFFISRYFVIRSRSEVKRRR